MAGNGGVVVVVNAQDGTEGVFNAIDKHLAATRAKAEATSLSLSSLGSALSAVGLTVGVGEIVSKMKEAVTSAGQFGEQMVMAKAKTGLAVETLSTLSYAANLAHTDFDAVSSAIGKLGGNLALAANGNTQLNAVFKNLGINAAELATRGDGVEIAFKRVAQVLSGTISPAQQLALSKQLLGKAGQQLIPVLQDIGANYDEIKKAAQAAGVVLNDQQANTLAKLDDKFDNLEQSIKGAGVSFTQGMTPALSNFLDLLAGSEDKAEGFQRLGSIVGKAASLMLVPIASVASGLEGLFAISDSLTAISNPNAKETLAHDIEQMKKYDQMARDAMEFLKTGKPKNGETQDALLGGTRPKPIGYTPPPDLAEASKMRDAQRQLADAERKRDEERDKAAAAQAKARNETAIAELDAQFKARLVPEERYYAERARLQRDSLQKEQDADASRYSRIQKEMDGLRKNPGATEVDQVKTKTKLVELSSQQEQIAAQIAERTEKIRQADVASVEAARERVDARRKESDEIAAQLETIKGGTAARLQQSDDAYAIRRAELANRYANEPADVRESVLRNADSVHENEKQHIVLDDDQRGADLAARRAGLDRQTLDYQVQSGQVGRSDARERQIAINAREAESLQPVLEAYQKLAASGDLDATVKVAELSEKIYELKNPIDEISESLRDGIGGAFEGLFSNMDEPLKSLESFASSVRRTLDRAVYQKAVAPQIERLVDGITSGIGFGGTKKASAQAPALPDGVDLGQIVRPTFGGSPAVTGAAGKRGGFGGFLDGILGKGGSQKTVTVTLVNTGPLPLDVASVTQAGGDGLENWEAMAEQSYQNGGAARMFGGGR